MNRHGWSTWIILRYALFQVPALILLGFSLFLIRQWVNIPVWLIWGIIGFWLAKDVILFPFTWRSYDQNPARDANAMVGLRGIAQEHLAPSGYIQVHGELWQAEVMEGGQPIDKGEGIRVQGTRGLTLLVRPDNSEGIEPESNRSSNPI
jgi:membrane protein implicated in regulation of membrane protease activity